jgi:hypothetical protein
VEESGATSWHSNNKDRLFNACGIQGGQPVCPSPRQPQTRLEQAAQVGTHEESPETMEVSLVFQALRED